HTRSAGHSNSPFEQVGTHSPSAQPEPAGQVAPLSTRPSQSLSLPSHASGMGPVPPRHIQAAPPPGMATQVFMPGRHSPTAGEPAGNPGGGHGPGGFSPLSTWPSQLSSRALHTSGSGSTPPSQNLAPPAQRVMPGLQMPTLEPHTLPRS